MSFDFSKDYLHINDGGTVIPQFFKKGFWINRPSSPSPGWQDVTVSGENSLNLVNAKANGLNYLKLYGACKQSNLPDGYTQTEYTRNNNGSTYINTGYKPKVDDFEMEIKVMPSTDSWYIFESRYSTSSGQTGIIGANSGSTIGFAFNGTAATSSISRDTTHIYTINAKYKNGTGTLYVKDETTGDTDTKTITYTFSSVLKNIGLFGNTTGQGVKAGNKIYYAWLKSEDEYVLNYIPCIYNGVSGFYDTVTSSFVGATTGALTAEGTAVPIPTSPINIKCNNGMLKVNAQGQIYTDGTVETIQITGKNLFNTEGSTYNKYIDSSGDEQVSSNFAYTDYIRVYPNTTYTFAVSQVFENRGNNHRVFGYDANKTFIGQEANVAIAASEEKGARESGTFTTGSTTEYLRLNYIYDPDGEQPQLEFGSTATTYEPYFNGDTAAAENLLSISTYKDVQSVIDGDIKRNIGVKVLDGSETWVQYPNSTTYYTDDAITDNKLSVMANMLLCTHYAPTVGSPMPENTIRFRMDNSLKVLSNRLYIADTINSTLADWKAWLAQQYTAGTPVIVVFPATPTTETVTGQSMKIAKGSNTISITQASINPLSLEANYKAGVEVTVQEVEDANLDNNVTVTID